jgi:colanic acid biosynthesis protein WcaH
MRLGTKEFLEVVERTPLVSIDLIVRRPDGAVLLGKRTNEPARDCWFVPGGRIHKDETIEAAFRRISLGELGKRFALGEGRFLGVFEHFYDTNFARAPGFGTHYVVLAYEVTSSEMAEQPPDDQHAEFRWFDVPALLTDQSVHSHTKSYFSSK